ncbi:MAG: PRC-barrel domain-containing protein [Pirellulaceae bacterium]
MRVTYLTIGFACLLYLGLGLAPTEVSAQRYRGSQSRRPAANRQSECSPAQAAPTATSRQTLARSNPSTKLTQPPTFEADQTQQQGPGQAEHAQSERRGRIVRGSQMIGMTLRGSDDQQLGVVKDFILDSQGEGPMIYFAVEPDASLQLDQEYVIIPYSAMQYRSDSRGASDYFAMDVIGTGLRNAPRVAVNDWSNFNDPHVLSNVHQFYQRTTRTAARPIQGGQPQQHEQGTRPETEKRSDAGMPRDSTPQPERARPLDNTTQPKSAMDPESSTDPDTATRPKSSQPLNAGTRPDSKATEPLEQTVPRR